MNARQLISQVPDLMPIQRMEWIAAATRELRRLIEVEEHCVASIADDGEVRTLRDAALKGRDVPKLLKRIEELEAQAQLIETKIHNRAIETTRQ